MLSTVADATENISTPGLADRLRNVNTSATRRHLARFLVIGTCSAATDLGSYLLLLNLAHWPPSTAKALSYVIGMVVAFFGNKYWTFESPRRSLSEPAAFVVIYLASLLVNVGINSGVLALLDGSLAARLVAFVAATGVSMTLNFLGMRLVAFRRGIHERHAC